jgi:hypothetical protein
MSRASCLRDQGVDVVDLALECIRLRIAALAAAPTSVVVDREIRRELGGKRRVLRPVVESPADHDHCWSTSLADERDRGAIWGRDVTHLSPPFGGWAVVNA